MAKYYNSLDSIFSTFTELLNQYSKSEILQNYYYDIFVSIFYAELIRNIFANINPENIQEMKLSSNIKIKFENEYAETIKDIELTISGDYETEPFINETYYANFKNKVKLDFPELSELINEIENIIDMEYAYNYLSIKKEEIKEAGILDADFDQNILSSAIESLIPIKGFFPDGKYLAEIISKKFLPEMSEEWFNSIENNSEEFLNEQREFRITYEKDMIYGKWDTSLDLFELMINFSLEHGKYHVNKVNKEKNKEDYKFIALTLIHARGIQISNEILALLKAGFPDGANARWRSIYELAVISFVLLNNKQEVSKGYLDHETMITFKDAKVYQKYHNRLNVDPLEKKVIDSLNKTQKKLIEEYGKEFKQDWGWIPESISKNKNFRALAEYAEMDHLYPYYKLSSAAVHGLSRGFYRLGLREDCQQKFLVCGSSNYGLEDPIQNAAISLSQITTCLLNVETNFENQLIILTMQKFIEEIGNASVKIKKAKLKKWINISNSL